MENVDKHKLFSKKFTQNTYLMCDLPHCINRYVSYLLDAFALEDYHSK